MSESPARNPGRIDPTKDVTDAFAAVDIAALSDKQLRRMHAALTYMHEVLAKEAERRAESDETIQSIYQANSARFDSAALHALETLAAQGWFDRLIVQSEVDSFEAEMPELRRTWMRLRWHFSRPIARAIAVGRLIKTAFTFGDWVPYAVWKVERHTGQKVELSERQRKHPLIFAWPVIWRVLISYFTLGRGPIAGRVRPLNVLCDGGRPSSEKYYAKLALKVKAIIFHIA